MKMMLLFMLCCFTMVIVFGGQKRTLEQISGNSATQEALQRRKMSAMLPGFAFWESACEKLEPLGVNVCNTNDSEDYEERVKKPSEYIAVKDIYDKECPYCNVLHGLQ